jgi:hypothetical protein
MNESERERILDARIMRRLATDNAYRYAENAEEQAEREEQITREEEERLDWQIGEERHRRATRETS